MIHIRDISKKYNDLEVFKDFNFSIKDGEIIGLLGPSGCGKTTLLNIVAGLIHYDNGCIEGVNKRDISYIFQETRLLPWATLKENILFVLKSRYNKSEAEALTKQYLEFVNLYEYRDYLPSQLSGGMKQRASIARAFAYPSQVLLMDEPFKGLDFELKHSLIQAFISLWEKDKRTVLFVTHDFDEALLLANTIYILHQRPADIKSKMDIKIPRKERELETPAFINYKNRLKSEIKCLGDRVIDTPYV